MRNKPIWLSILLTVVFSFQASAQTKHQTDYLQFLKQPDFQVMTDEKQNPRSFPGGHDEKYWAMDHFGKTYKLRLKNALPSYAEVISSVLADAVHLPQAPVYPVLVKRGENAIPSSEKAKNLDLTNQFLGLSGARGEYVPATLQPTVKLEAFSATNLSVREISEAIEALLFNGVIGNHDLQFGDGLHGNINYTKSLDAGSFMTLDMTQAFKFYGSQQSSLRDFLGQLPTSIDAAITRLSVSDKVLLGKELARFTLSLKTLNREQVENLMAAYQRGLTSLRQMKDLPPVDLTALLFQRISEVELTLKSWAKQRNLPLEFLSATQTARVTELHLPSPLTGDMDGKVSASGTLWKIYFMDFWKARAIELEKLGATNSLAQLQDQARATSTALRCEALFLISE